MKDRKGTVALLAVIALAIWCWNAYQLLENSERATLDWDDRVPEVPLDALNSIQQELPEMNHDPFSIVPKTRAEPDPRVPQQRGSRAVPPMGTLQIILERDNVIEAFFGDPSGETLELKVGDTLQEWTVKELTLEKMVLQHKSGAIHEMPVE